ncbi:MAG: hypothetical protein ABIG42_01565 [bacterium]
MNTSTENTDRFNSDVLDNRDTIRAKWILYAILILAAHLSVSYAFYLMISEPLSESRFQIHNSVIAGTAPKPLQYRIMTYYLVEATHRITGMSIWRLDLILRFIFTSLSLIFMFKYLRRWFDFAASAIGPFIILAILPVTYVDYTHQPHDIPNLFFTILALGLIRDKKEAWLLLLIPVAMLNRESFIFVLWAWFFYNYDRLPIKLLIADFTLFSLFALVIYLALPHYYGPRDNYVDTIQLSHNLKPEFILKWFKRLVAFIGPLVVGTCIAFKSKPLFLRRSLGFVGIFMAVNFVVGMYHETRLFLPVLPVMIPLGLSAIFPAFDPDNKNISSGELTA